MEESEALFVLKRKIGAGAYGSVYLAISAVSKEDVALKIMAVEAKEAITSEELHKLVNALATTTLSDLKAITGEINILKQATECPYIVGFRSAHFLNGSVWLALEYCDCGSLANLLKRGLKMSDEQIASVALQVAQGLAFLHKLGIIHRDMKADNILLTAKGEAKIADFGVSTFLKEASRGQTAIGSPYWMAPELILEKSYGTPIDIWGLGITTIEMAEGAPPLYDELPFRALFIIAEGEIPPTLSRPSERSQLLNEFVAFCTQREAFARPSTAELLEPATPPPEQHPFLKQITGKENEILRGMAEPFVSTDNNNASLDLSLGVKGLLVSQTVSKEDVSAEAVSTSKSDIGKISDLVKRMRNPSTGLVIKDRRYHLRRYRKCFIGSEAVDWMMADLPLESREQAVNIGQTLMYRAIIRHVVDTESFADKYFFYCFAEDMRGEDDLDENKINAIVARMRDPHLGLDIKDRKWRLQKFPKCFVGEECVTWMIEQLRLPSRQEAVQLGQILADRGVFHHVARDKPFADKYLFYRMYIDDETLSKNNKTSGNK